MFGKIECLNKSFLSITHIGGYTILGKLYETVEQIVVLVVIDSNGYCVVYRIALSTLHLHNNSMVTLTLGALNVEFEDKI